MILIYKCASTSYSVRLFIHEIWFNTKMATNKYVNNKEACVSKHSEWVNPPENMR